MNTTQIKICNASKKIAIILKIGTILSSIGALLIIGGICILAFTSEETKTSFLSAFDIRINNRAVLNIASQPLILMFILALINIIVLTIIIYFVYLIFRGIEKTYTPFHEKNTSRIKIIAGMTIILSIIGSFSDAVVDYYTIGQLTWKLNIEGIVIGIIIYFIALVFHYGCELQKESDETL